MITIQLSTYRTLLFIKNIVKEFIMNKKFLLSSLFFITCILILFVIGCQNPYYPEEAYYFISYRFNANENDALSSSVEGIINTSEKTVSLTVPYGTDVTSLVASFSLNNMGLVWVGDSPQVSRVTPNDFSEPVKYTLPSQEGSLEPNDWYVQVNVALPIRYVSINGDDSNDGTETHPWRTIQHAIDSVADGYTIIVNPGTYNENIEFDNRNITVQSTDPLNSNIVANTIIDGGQNGTVATFIKFDNSTLKGLTIQNGYVGGSPTLDEGGGILMGNSDSTIEYNRIINNTADYGGGFFIYNSSPTIRYNSIKNNNAPGSGGGIYMHYSQATIEYNDIVNNVTEGTAGGIRVLNSTSVIRENNINYNGANFAGGINVQESDITLENNVINHNKASELGGGVYVGKDSNLFPDNIRPTGWGSSGGSAYRLNIPKDESSPSEPIDGPAGNIFSGNRHGTPLRYTEGAHVYFE